MLDMEIDRDSETRQVYKITLDINDGESCSDDVIFLTKLADGLMRGATIVIDPGLATEFVYEAEEPVEGQSEEASE
jgi:hypothetical protein